MKRIYSIVLSFALLLSLSACGSSGGSSTNGAKSGSTPPAANPPSASAEDTTGQDASTPEVEPELTGAGSLGDYYVEIKSAALTKDYEGKPVIAITYAWTNNSDKTTSAMVAVSGKAFQDGVSLETAIVMGDDVYDPGTSMTEVRPGTTIDVQSAFVLSSETSVVEFELSELISFSDDVVRMDFDPTAL